MDILLAAGLVVTRASHVVIEPDPTRAANAYTNDPSSLSPGHSQVFALDPESGALRQLTEVRGEVSRFSSTEDGALVYVASDADPARSHLGLVAATRHKDTVHFHYSRETFEDDHAAIASMARDFGRKNALDFPAASVYSILIGK